MTEPELKPCPFCGGVAEVQDATGADRVWHVKCLDCCATAGPAGLCTSRGGAVELWNARAAGPETRERGTLQWALEQCHGRVVTRIEAERVWQAWSGCLTAIAMVCWANEYANSCLYQGRFAKHPGWASEGLWVDGEGLELIVREWP